MVKNDNKRPAILAGLFENVAWVRVIGKGSFQNSPQLRSFCERVFKTGNPKVVIDLEDCPIMDSTFMGTLTGLALQIRGSSDAALQVINPNPRNAQLLKSLGVDQVLDVDTDGSSWQNERALVRENLGMHLDAVAEETSDRKQHVMDAHEALCQANEANVSRFKDVLEYLRQDLQGSEEKS